MADDVLITPALRKIEFYDSSSNMDAKIELDADGNLNITNPGGGDINIGDTSADIFIGDGVSSIDLVFEQDGSIRGTGTQTITLGQTGDSVVFADGVNVTFNEGFTVQGTSGELFSITDTLTGTIFSVNDISGIPSIEVDDDGTIRLAEFSGNVLIGTAVDNGTDLVQVDGTVNATTVITSDLQDSSNRTLRILDAANNVVWGG